MAQILDQHQDLILCSECQKYLSVFPVKVYEDGSVKCGRCCKPNDGGVESLYEKLTKNCLFKCVNRYEGCRKLLFPCEAGIHEQNCLGRNYDCPTCEMDSMSACQLIQHYKSSHRENVLTSNIFHQSLSKKITKEKFLYVQGYYIFFIIVKYVPNDKYFYITAVTLCELENVKQQYVISLDELSFKLTTTSQKCTFLDNLSGDCYYKIDVSGISNFLKIGFSLDVSQTSNRLYELQYKISLPVEPVSFVELTPAFRREYPKFTLAECGRQLYLEDGITKISLSCANCKQFMGHEVYFCHLTKHFSCRDCKGWCYLCKSPKSPTLNDIKSKGNTSLNKLLLFPCKFNCGTKFAGIRLRTHELICEINQQACSICQIVVKSTNGLKIHMENEHSCNFDEDFNVSNFLVKHKDKKVGKTYFIVNANIFKAECTNEMVYPVLEFEADFTPYLEYTLRVTPCTDVKNLEINVILDKKHLGWHHKGSVTIDERKSPEIHIKYG